MKVWITKYALTKGVFEIEAEEIGSDMVRDVNRKSAIEGYYHKEGRDWHRTLETAVGRAEIMRDRKLAALEKERNRLVALRFV